MKKLFIILLCLSAIVIPRNADAKSFDFTGYYCDTKQPLGDGTFYMTCHIVVKTDFNINHVAGKLHLKNVTLTDIKTKSDWKSNNGLSSDVDFTSTSDHMGSMTVADLIFTGNLKDTECNASFEPLIAEEVIPDPVEPDPVEPDPVEPDPVEPDPVEPDPVEPDPIEPEPNPVCAILDNEYYGKNGNKVTEEKYYEECCNYVCTVVDNKYYYDSNGKSVSYDVFLQDCSREDYIPETPQTGIDYGYIVLPLGILSLFTIKKIAYKNNKIYKI